MIVLENVRNYLFQEVGSSVAKSRHHWSNLTKLLGDVMNKVAALITRVNHIIVERSCLAIHIILGHIEGEIV